VEHTTDIEYCNPFDEKAPDFWMKIEHLARYLYAKELIKERNLNKVADVGCADSYGTIELSKVSESVTGIDFSERLLELSRENVSSNNIKNIDFLKCDLEKENLSNITDSKFDFITCFETLEHLSNPKEVLSEYHKVLKKHGVLMVSVPNKAFEPIKEDGTPRNPYHKQLFSEKDIVKLLKENNFTIEKLLYQPYTNIFFNKELKLIEDGLYETEVVNGFYNHGENSIRYFARLFGLPDVKNKDDSYSIIALAVKR
jgi:2-polyprenyl-3-methyl-5-hydroxy-6-metoxy-1,4-benzoquinol methylase